jgi:hypothetical protein
MVMTRRGKIILQQRSKAKRTKSTTRATTKRSSRLRGRVSKRISKKAKARPQKVKKRVSSV